ncbi:MAG: hypothetical protein ACK4YM_00045 [Novosphingobium sp.]
MRKAQPAIGLKAKGYQRFAWVVLGLAVIVAMASNDVAPAGAGSPMQAARRDAPAAKPGPGARAIALPAAIEPDDGPDDSLAENGAAPSSEPALAAEPAELIKAQDRGHPPLPGTTRAGPQQVRAAPPRPSSAELDRLVASSRLRSGGVDQGDEISRRS